jgi:hypothetical protein
MVDLHKFLFERIRNRSAIANDFEARNRSANAISFYKKFTSLVLGTSFRLASVKAKSYDQSDKAS